MPDKLKILIALSLIATCMGCAQIMDVPKVIWGSSTRALENARVDAVSETYKCSLTDCFDAVLDLERKERKFEEEVEGETVVKRRRDGKFDVFIKSRKKKHIVVIGVDGSVETTEVGVFFTQPTLTSVKVEISSLSSSAKHTVAEIVFNALDTRFSKAQ